MQTVSSLALPANTPHTLLALEGPYAGVAYLDARRYRFEDVQRLTHGWRGFRPGRDDLREAFGEALKPERRRVDARLLTRTCKQLMGVRPAQMLPQTVYVSSDG